jgi:hypothetical protein
LIAVSLPRTARISLLLPASWAIEINFQSRASWAFVVQFDATEYWNNCCCHQVQP